LKLFLIQIADYPVYIFSVYFLWTKRAGRHRQSRDEQLSSEQAASLATHIFFAHIPGKIDTMQVCYQWLHSIFAGKITNMWLLLK
jgi:hypothetical protein